MVSKTSEADIWLSSYDHLTYVGGQRGGCQKLSHRKGVCFLLNKKEALSGLIQVNDDEERIGGQAWKSMVASNRYLRVSNPGLQMLGSNECDVTYQYGTRASFQHIRIPALYILKPKKNLRQLDSCQPSSQYEWSVDGWMCCQITTTGSSIQKPSTTPNFHNRKIPRFDRNNPIMTYKMRPTDIMNASMIIRPEM